MKKLLFLSLALSSQNTFASNETDDWEAWDQEPSEETAGTIPVSGFLQYFFSNRTVDNDLISEDTIANEVRLRLETTYHSESWYVNYKGDLYFDEVSSKASARNREAFIHASPTSAIDLRAGRQILTWGTGDLLFLNDLFPKNWKAFFSGDDQQYLKNPSDALKASWYSDVVNIDLVWSPIFDHDTYIDGERFSYFSHLYNAIVAASPIMKGQSPEHDIDNGEYSARIYRNISGTEYAGYFYRGFYKTPEGFDPLTDSLYFPRMNAIGASARGSVLSGIGYAEFSYYDSVEDRDGKSPYVPNSETRFLIGYEQEIVKDLTLSVQGYLEHIHDYKFLAEETEFLEHTPEQNRNVLTIRITYLALNNNLVWTTFLFYSPNDHDLYLLPSAKYRVDDNFEVSAGFNYFKGDYRSTMFGQFEENSNAYLRVKFIF